MFIDFKRIYTRLCKEFGLAISFNSLCLWHNNENGFCHPVCNFSSGDGGNIKNCLYLIFSNISMRAAFFHAVLND